MKIECQNLISFLDFMLTMKKKNKCIFFFRNALYLQVRFDVKANQLRIGRY